MSAGTGPARYPIANQQPRIITARVATKAVIATIDSTLLDVMLTLEQSRVTGATGACTETGEPINTEPDDKASLSGQPASGNQISALQASLSTLITEFSAYDEIVKRMQASCAEERQARETLAARLDRLMSLLGAAANET